jgi:hypothetical protein
MTCSHLASDRDPPFRARAGESPRIVQYAADAIARLGADVGVHGRDRTWVLDHAA